MDAYSYFAGQMLLALISVTCCAVTFVAIGRGIPKFIQAGIVGIDVNKSHKPKLPESIGLVAGAVYLVGLTLLIPILFANPSPEKGLEPNAKLTEFLSAIVSINCMILLGFSDDVLNLKWKYKLIFPAISSFPVLVLYHLSNSPTSVKLPRFVESYLNTPYVDLGGLYYGFMLMLVVFCTNSINILAGINGIEAGQSLIIATSILVNNLIQLEHGIYQGHIQNHFLSLLIVVPYISITIPLLYYNWYPATVFLGDTFCYFSGTVFSLAGILGHFTKTLGLFMGPQIFNFVYSCPQLFHLVPCPRHRMPSLNPQTGLLEMSLVAVPKPRSKWHPRNLAIEMLHRSGLLFKRKSRKENVVYINNLTLINLALYWLGPTKENVLVKRLLAFHVASNLLGFFLRYHLVHLFYD